MSAPVARRYFARGKEQLRAGDLDAATQSFAAAVELAPYFVEARVGAALTLARSDPPRAAQLLRAGRTRHEAPAQTRLLALHLELFVEHVRSCHRGLLARGRCTEAG